MVSDKNVIFWVEANKIFDKICHDFDLLWQKRKRVLSTQLLVIFILKAVLSKEKQGYSSSLIQLWETCSEKEIVLPQVNSVAASSLCEARQKLSEEIFKQLNTALIEHWHNHKKMPRWRSHKVFAIDGSKINVPYGLVASGYDITKNKGRYYPQGTLSCLYNLQEQIVYDVEFVSHRDEREYALKHLIYLSADDIVIFDRGYFSYYMFYKILEMNLNAVFRLQMIPIEGIEAFWKSDEKDTIIEYTPSATIKSELKKRGLICDMKPIKIRLVKYIIDNETYVCATTLMDKEVYPGDCFCDLYHGRWGIEELHKISKTFIDVEDFHPQTERGVEQELYGNFFLINLARMFEFDALKKLSSEAKEDDTQDETVEKLHPGKVIKINFKNCLLIVGRHLENLVLSSKEPIIRWLEKALCAIAKIKQRIRPDRHYPRVSHQPRNKWSSWREKNA